MRSPFGWSWARWLNQHPAAKLAVNASQVGAFALAPALAILPSAPKEGASGWTLIAAYDSRFIPEYSSTFVPDYYDTFTPSKSRAGAGSRHSYGYIDTAANYGS